MTTNDTLADCQQKKNKKACNFFLSLKYGRGGFAREQV